MLFVDKKFKALEMVVNAVYDWLTFNKLTFNVFFFFQLTFNFAIYHLIQKRPNNKPKINLTLHDVHCLSFSVGFLCRRFTTKT